MGINSQRSQEWLIKFIKSSKTMIEANDKDAVAIAKEFNNFIMPDSPLSETEIKAVLGYIKTFSKNEVPASVIADTTVGSGKADIVEAVVGNAETGKNLFEGRTLLSAGGPACLACHHINFAYAEEGGLLSKNLTYSFKTIGGEAGISGILTSPPFPAMLIAYKNNNLTTPEIAHISAYLKITSEQKYSTGMSQISMTFVFGFFITTGLFFLIYIIWRKRKTGSVNDPIIAR
jgi:hypothetical protein